MEKSCAEWLTGFASSDWQLVGAEDRPEKFFAIAFKAPGAAGGRQADKALQSLKDKNGRWQQLYTAAPSGRDTQMYVGPDKSRKQ
eukprot:10876592-Karenia_brevis.AAC.1